jgi:hypothetical protein
MSDGDALAPLPIDADLWSHRQLLERIVERWFGIIEESSGVDLGWTVKLNRDDLDPSEALAELNAHLRQLAWIALLHEGDPYELYILPEPPRGEGLSNGQMAAVWIVFTGFLSLAGGAWMILQHPDQTLLGGTLLFDSFQWFALPIVLTLFICSECRRRLGLKHGVDLGHHLPLAVPFLLTPAAVIWPFGMIGFVSQRRLDLTPFKNRASLAAISMFAPFSLILSGIAFTVAGFWLTPSIAPAYESAPILLHPALLPDLILSQMISPDDLALRAAWLHPLGLAGITLTTMGWILLLPLPGFPGDRLLTALIGPESMEEGATQTWLFVGILVAGILILLNGSYWPWVILISIGAWRRFNPEISTAPFVLDEVASIPDNTRNQLGILLVAALLLGFPGLVPVSELEDWDAGLDTSDWPTEVSFAADEVVEMSFPLVTSGVVERDVEFEFRWMGAIQRNQIQSGCGNPSESCAFSNVGPTSQQDLVVDWASPLTSSINGPAIFQILWLEDGQTRTHDVSMVPDVTPIPAEMSWRWDGDLDSPEYCISVILDADQGANITANSPLFTFSGERTLALPTGDEMEVCTQGAYGSGWNPFPWQGNNHSFTPFTLWVTLDDGSVLEWNLPIENRQFRIAAGAWPAVLMADSVGDQILQIDVDAPPICPLEPVLVTPPVDADGNWNWSLEEIPLGVLPESVENGTFILPESGRILICDGDAAQHPVVADIVVVPSLVEFRQFTNEVTLINQGLENASIRVETVLFGVDHEWDVEDLVLLPGESFSFDLLLGGNATMIEVAWMEPTETDWILHLVAHCIAPEGCDA